MKHIKTMLKISLASTILFKKRRLFFRDQISLVDIALMPFVRQGAHVDLNWFSTSIVV